MERTETATWPSAASGGGSVSRRSLLSRLSFGHAVMIAAGLLAFLLNVMILRGTSETVEVPVAAHSIEAGSRLADHDITFRSIDADGPFVDRVLSRQAITALFGEVVIRDLDSGAPLLVGDLRPVAAPDQGRAMSIPISPERAVGADLYVGDRVDVISVDDGRSRFVATGIEVLDVTSGDGRAVSSRFGLTVAVSDVEALAIAAALDQGTVHVVRSTGMAPPRDPEEMQRFRTGSLEAAQ